MSQKFLSDVTLSTVTAGSMLKLDANGKIVEAVDGTDYISTSSTGFWTASSGSGIYYSDDVRIGTYQTTIAPDAKLHVFDYQTTEPKLLIEDGNTGDASMQFKISTQSYTIGVDNSDSDKFVLSAGSVLGTGNLLEITSNGLAAFQDSVLIKGTLYVNNQEQIQQGATEKIATFQNLGTERGYFEVTDTAKGYFVADGFKTSTASTGFLKADGSVDTGSFFSGNYSDLSGTPTLGTMAAASTNDYKTSDEVETYVAGEITGLATTTYVDTGLSGKLSTSGGTIYNQTNTTGTSGTSFLTIHNNVGGDISQQQSFIDFMFTDTNANFYPQVRIGAQVGRDADANAISKEGAGAFVVYTGDGTDESGGGSLTEAMRVSYNGKLTVAGDIYSGTSKIATESFVISEAGDVQDNLDSLSGSLGTAAFAATTDFDAAGTAASEAGSVQDNLDSLSGSLGTAAYTASTDYATAAQGTTADAALPKAGGTMTGTLKLDSELQFLRGAGSGDYSNYIRANNYPSEGYTSTTAKYWLEYGAKGGHHFILNTDGGDGSAQNAYDDFTIWQGEVDGDRLFEVTNVGNVNITGSLSASGYNNTNWDTAYGWGDHSGAGYLTTVPSEYLTQNEGDARYVSFEKEDRSVPSSGGWYRLAKIGRGGARFAISYTGGNMSPHTYVIDAFKNWNNEATIAVEKFGHANYITSFRISRREGTGNGDYYLEGEFTSLSNTHSFEARFQESLGYTSISEIYAVSSGSVLAASDSTDSEIIEELDTTASEGLYLKNISLDGRLNIYTDDNTSSTTALVLNGTEVEKRTLGSNAFSSTSFAPLDSPALTGTPTAPTAAAATNTTQVATTAFVTTAVSNLVDSSPAALNTLNELAAALGDDASFSTTMSTALGNRLRIDVNNQSLSSTELTNARTNLGLGTAATSAATSFVAVSGDSMTGDLTSTGVITSDVLRLTNDATDTTRHRIAVYDSGSTSYGMMLWNSNGASGDWATMIYGPNQSDRRISFGKANANFATNNNHAGVDEIAHFDLDDSSLNLSGALTISAAANAAWLASFTNTSASGHGLIIQAGGTTGTRYITQWKDAAGTERFHMDDTGEAYFQNTIQATGGINGLTLANGGISGTNYNITGVNQLEIADPGEGIVFKSGSSGDMTLAIVDDTSDNILRFSGTNATFDVAGSLTATNLTIADAVYHEGDTNTSISFGTDTINFNTGGGVRAIINDSGAKFNNNTIIAGGSTLSLGERAEGDDNGRTVLIEGVAGASSGEGSGRIFFSEHNSTDAAADKYGLSLYYEGNPNAQLPSGFQPNTGNGTWSLRRHDNSTSGAAIMSGGRTTNNVTFSGTVTVAGRMYVSTVDANATSTTALVLGASNEIEKRTLGTNAFNSIAYLEDISPATPSVSSATVVGETIEITFAQSSTPDVDYYQVWSAVGSGGSYGMIAHVPQEDVASSMTVIDATFDVSDTIYYRVYAVKSGIYSTAGTINREFSSAALDVSNMSVVNLNTAYYIQYEMPDSRFVDHVEIYMDAEASAANLTRTGATLVYSGNNTSYMYKIGANDLDKYHQFWVEVVES
jgi:hypothetical protein